MLLLVLIRQLAGLAGLIGQAQAALAAGEDAVEDFQVTDQHQAKPMGTITTM